MLSQEWDWNKAFEINARDAARDAEKRVNEQWKAVVADKDAALADKDAIIAELNARISSLSLPS